MPHNSFHRRSFLQASIAGASLTHWPLANAQGARAPAKKRSLILLWQDGGPSHFETFDPKPDAPSEYRGELGTIATSLPGISYCEVLPRLARLASQTAVIRSLHQPSSGHVIGSHNVLTGWTNETEGGKSRYPDLASVISRMRSGVEDAEISIGASTDARLAQGLKGAGKRRPTADGSALPQYIDIGKGLHRGGPAFLGPIYGPFQVSGDPSKPGFVVQNLESVGTTTRLLARQQMLEQLEQFNVRRELNVAGWEQLHAVDGLRQQALDLLSGGAAARAFDFTREPTAIRERYGLHVAGQQCLLARRLVEAGAGVVAIRFSPDGRGDYDRSMIGWDDHAVHGNIFAIMRQRGPQFDQSLSALIEDLQQRGMEDEVLVVLVGEFGRTPRIHVHKGCPGREHWGPSGCAMLFGGGLEMGQVIGQTNARGERPADRPLTYQDLLATIYQSMGVDTKHTFINHAGRPVPVLPSGQPISDLAGRPAARGPDRASTNRGATDVRSVRTPNEHNNSITIPAATRSEDFQTIRGLSQFEKITLDDTQIDDLGLAVLRNCKNLRQLSLSRVAISDGGLAHLATLTNLEELNLSFTRITSAGLQTLNQLTRLKRVSFIGTPITLLDICRLFIEGQGRPMSDALFAMGLAIRDQAQQLVSINVASTPFGDAQLAVLDSQDSLRELQLTATQVSDVGMEQIVRFRELKHLFLAKCNIGDPSMKYIGQLRQLESLNLYGTKITSAALSELTTLEKLRTLYITDLKLSTAAVDELKKELPQLTLTDYTPA